MRLIPLAPSAHVLEYAAFRILFSYQLPVAVHNTVTDKAWRLSPSPSKTSSRHINAFFVGLNVPVGELTQAEIDQLF